MFTQPLMTLLFGRLVQSFVAFGIALSSSTLDSPEGRAALAAAGKDFKDQAALNSSYLVYIGALLQDACHCVPTNTGFLGVGSFACTFLYMYIWVYTGEIDTKRLRERYLQAIVLRQDIAYFDNVGAGEVATRIQTDTCTLLHYLFSHNFAGKI